MFNQLIETMVAMMLMSMGVGMAKPVMLQTRRWGKPKSEAERRASHKAKYGTEKVPPRGTRVRGALSQQGRWMRVYPTTKGETICSTVIEEGYRQSRSTLGLSDRELDCLRVIADPIFGVDKLRGDEVAEQDKPIWKKLAGLGYVEIEEY